MTNWNQEAEGGNAPKIPAGMGLKLRIAKILTESKKKGEFMTRSGDPMIMVVFEDAEENEAITMLTLSKKAQFRMAQLLSAIYPSGSLDKLTSYGVTIEHFKFTEFAKQMLLDRYVVCDLSYDEQGYAEFVFAKWTPNIPEPKLPTSAASVAEETAKHEASKQTAIDTQTGSEIPF